VYQARERYEAKAKFTTWLYKIATNLCLNKIREKKKFRTVSLSKSISTEEGKEEELIEEIADPSPSPQEILEEREKNVLIRKAIDSLPTKQRIATILRTYEELSYKEISKILGCSVKSVERRLYWARANLKEKLVPYDGELDEKQKLLVKRHLLECTECEKEADLLSKTSYFLKNLQRLMPSEDFEANLWKKIYFVEKKEVRPYLLRRVAYIILPAAVAAALIIGVFRGNLVERITSSQNVNLQVLSPKFTLV